MADLINYSRRLRRLPKFRKSQLPEECRRGVGERSHLTLKDVVDAQAAKEWPMVYSNLRTAASHMAMIADPLGVAIAKQFPEKYAQR